MEEQVDVLICGGGSAGLCAGVWLARCGIRFQVLEQRDGPLERGQADGVQCRTTEIFESFGLSDTLLNEAYHSSEVAFWAPEDGGTDIRRTRYAADRLSRVSHLPHVLLGQARMNELLTNEMESAAGGTCVEYGCEVLSVEVDSENAQDPDAYCVTVAVLKDGTERKYRTKYVLGSDGAHSAIRKSLGFKMVGDTSDSVWGVMDTYPRTNFPDIRKKAIIQSAAGNLIIIPREGDLLVRFYIELKDSIAKDVTLEELHEKLRLILRPYDLEVAETAWWSAYSIGQRLADRFHKDYRVFLGGDACHTHSPKAGQGMNVSLQDGYNIGWKLAAVIRGQATPELLETYVSERQKTAAELIEFDRTWSKLFSTSYRKEHGITPEQFHDKFLLSARHTAGQAVNYNDSLIVSSKTSEASLATGLTVGMRLPSVPVIRFSDARVMQLVRFLPSQSWWHVLVFPGDIRDSQALTRLQNFSSGLQKIVDAFTPPDVDGDAVINPILIFSSGRTEVEPDQIPPVFTPIVSKWKMKSLTKVFSDDDGYNSPSGHAYETYGIDPNRGAVVIVRPDHYISKICSLESIDAIMSFFDGFMKRKAV
ncbi:FAD binding domain-containing protein [Daldinia vernicosa]|uniref:FAD binding domain-containing protein n=1 Tax=Daldinia vernicosa TaxID=114800 RepID=UPI002007A8DA|nr:FAD binding domain-containing protein [Daldinia vernicosa]KAI0851628.1 FAD binding domain-containing protein [Daldinia vernicosa]